MITLVINWAIPFILTALCGYIAKELKDKYQKVYGPLTINFPCNKWRWLEEPWVSFGLEVI